MKKFYWECPKCKEIVDFSKALREVFSEETEQGYEADFDPKGGLYFHTINCDNCNTDWVMGIGGAIER